MSEGVRGGGFHEGERAVQRRAGVAGAAARLEGMLGPAELSAGVAGFLADRTFVAITARDARGRLWVSPLTGRPGFVEVSSRTSLVIHAAPGSDDPLHGLTAQQPVAIIALDYARRRRFRLNGTLTATSSDGLSVRVDEAYGNCPQFIPQRDLALLDQGPAGVDLDSVPDLPAYVTESDRAVIAQADTFILGTTHPVRGNDASHRGGPPGFVRTAGSTLWWPDYAGNNMFNSLGNLAVDPEAALLFLDFAGGTALHLSGTAELQAVEVGAAGDDGHTGRRVVLTVGQVARSRLGFRADLRSPYAQNPPLTDSA
jgi:hypothetical protein